MSPSGSLSAALNLLNTILGGGLGILPIPYLVRTAGVHWAALLLMVVGIWASHTSHALVRAWTLTGGDTYEAVALRTLGVRASLLVSTIIVVFLFGVCVGCLDAVADVASELVPREWALVIATVLVSPVLVVVDGMEALAPLSALAAVLVALFVGYAALRAALGPRAASLADGLVVHSSMTQLLNAMSIAIFSYLAHFNLLAIARTLPGSTRAEQAAGMNSVIRITTALAFAVYLSVGLVGFLCFGEHTSGDILSNYAATAAGQVCRWVIAAGLLASTPLFAFEGVNELTQLWVRAAAAGSKQGASPPPSPRGEDEETTLRPGERSPLLTSTAAPSRDHRTARMLFAGLWCVSMALVAMVFSGTHSVFAITGAVCGTPVMCVLPPLMLLQCDLEMSEFTRSLNRAFAVLGVVATAACSTSAVYSAVHDN